MKVFNIPKFGKPTAVGADKYERVRKEANSARLVQDKFAWVDGGLVLVIQERSVNTLLGQNRRIRSAVHGAMEPAFNKLRKVFEKLLLNGGR